VDDRASRRTAEEWAHADLQFTGST